MKVITVYDNAGVITQTPSICTVRKILIADVDKSLKNIITGEMRHSVLEYAQLVDNWQEIIAAR